MGLAGTKKRTQIGHDPNNTTWTQATSRYGHRMLMSAGWTPGTTLGAKNAAHASHYTAASESHIRIAPCVEGKGLGAKNTTDDTFGLRVLSGLLGRLNGKDTTSIEQHLDRRRGEGYVEQRGWGVHFTFGGYLVGDKVEKDKSVQIDRTQEMPSKKRKRTTMERSDEAEMVSGPEGATNTKKMKKTKKRRSSKEPEATASIVEQTLLDEAGESSAAKLKRKAAKAQRKELRRLKREQKRRQKAGNSAESSSSEESNSQKQQSTLQSTVELPRMSSAAASGTSTPMFIGGRGRHAMRHKYIDQKRMACMDEKALNEVRRM